MTFLDYIDEIWLIAGCLALLAALACGIVFGIRRKTVLQATKFGLIVVSAIAAFFLAWLFGHMIGKSVYEAVGEDFIAQEFPEIVDDASVAEMMKALFCLLCAGLVFLPCWCVVGLLTLVPYLFIKRAYCKRAGGRPREFVGSGILGGFLGAVTGLFVFLVAVAPFVGCFNTAKLVLGTTKEDRFVDSKEVIERLDDTVLSRAVKAVGGKLVYDGLTAGKVDGEWVILDNELDAIHELQVIADNMTADEEGEATDPALFGGYADTIEVSPSGRIVAAVVLRNAATEWRAGKSYLGIQISDLIGGHEGNFAVSSAEEALLDRFDSITKENVVAVVRETENMLRAVQSMLNYFDRIGESGADAVAEMEEVLKHFDDTSRLILRGSVRAALEQSGDPNEARIEACSDLLEDAFFRLAQDAQEGSDREQLEAVCRLVREIYEDELTVKGLVSAMLDSEAVAAATEELYCVAGTWQEDPFDMADFLSPAEESEVRAMLADRLTPQNAWFVAGVMTIFGLN